MDQILTLSHVINLILNLQNLPICSVRSELVYKHGFSNDKMTTGTCIECEVNLAKYKCLERDYDRMNMEAQRDKDMMEATLQNDNTNPDVDFNAIRRDLCILPKCNDPKCLTRYGNYSVLLKLYEEHIVQRKKHFNMADISIRQNQIMGSSQILQRHSSRKDF